MHKRLALSWHTPSGGPAGARCPMYRIEISFPPDSKRSPKTAEGSGEGSLGYRMRGAFRLNGQRAIKTCRVTMAAAASVGIWLSTTAMAQNTFVVGTGGRPSVEIDLGVVDAPAGQQPITVAPGLAPIGSLPQQQLLYPNERSGGRITLTPPGSRTAPTLRRPPQRSEPAMAAVPRTPVLSAPIPASKPKEVVTAPSPTPAPALRAPAPERTVSPPAAAAPPAPQPPASAGATTTALRSTEPRIDTSRQSTPPPASTPAPASTPKVASKAPIAPSPTAAFPPPPAPLSKPPAADARPLPSAPQPKPPPAAETEPPTRIAATPPPAALPRPPTTSAAPSTPTVVAAPPPPPPPPLPAADAATAPPAVASDVPRVPRGEVAAAPLPPADPAPAPATAPARTSPPADATRVVALPPAGGDILRVEFTQGSSALTRDIESRLGALAAQLKATDARLQLKAFASTNGDNISQARRLSLSRALAVRSFLIEQGLRSTRIDVRALGIARDGGAADRVDVVLLSP